MATRRETDPRWGEVVVKEATGKAGRARLRREAEVLGWCRNPGVVELLHHEAGGEQEAGGERAVLVLRFCGARTLLDLASLPADQVAALGASLAQTLADLHQLGISHGNLLAEHVVLTDEGSPVLCGLADAGVAGLGPDAGGSTPPGALPEGSAVAVATAIAGPGFDPLADLEALTGLLRHLLPPLPSGRWRGGNPVAELLDASPPLGMADLAVGLARYAGPRVAPLRRTGVAEDVAPSQPVGRPTIAAPEARPEPRAPVAFEAVGVRPGTADEPVPDGICADEQLADWFFSDDLVDGPTRQFGPQPPQRSGGGAEEQRWPWQRRLALLAVAVMALLVGALTVVALGADADPAPAAPAEATTGAEIGAAADTDGEAAIESTVDPPAVPTAGASATGNPEAAPAMSAPAAPASGQDPRPQAPSTPTPTTPAGCPTTHDDAARLGIAATCAGVAHAEGNRIVVGPLTWELGAASDHAAVADFTCDGWLDAAALDGAGNVFVFDRWAGSGADAPAGRLVQHVPSAERLESRPAGNGCGVLAVVAGPGDPVLLGTGDLA